MDVGYEPLAVKGTLYSQLLELESVPATYNAVFDTTHVFAVIAGGFAKDVPANALKTSDSPVVRGVCLFNTLVSIDF